VPRELWGHPAVYKSARRRGKRPGEILLDRSLHHHAMRGLRDGLKRGRPDIVHFCMLEALGSPLNRAGLLELYVHTIGDYVVFVDPSTRLPRNYNRFVGLMEQLFSEGAVPPGAEKPLMWLRPMRLELLVRRLRVERVLLLSERGERRRLRDIASLAAEEPGSTAVLVGAFPHGDFSDEVYRLATHVYSFYPQSLDAWVVVSHFLALAADAMGVV